jgi:hypothetical protein
MMCFLGRLPPTSRHKPLLFATNGALTCVIGAAAVPVPAT